MPKASAKRFVLISLEDDNSSKHSVQKLRRYLNNNHFDYFFSSSSEEMQEYLEKLHNNNLHFNEILEDQIDYEENPELKTHSAELNKDTMTINVSSNQAMLEKWARETFSEDSKEMRLLFEEPNSEDKEAIQHQTESVDEDTNINLTPLFTVNSIEAESDNDKTDRKRNEISDKSNCQLCNNKVYVGRNRNTKIRRQAQHVLDSHAQEEFSGVKIEKRYQCIQCKRVLPVSKSPCEHISVHHERNDAMTEFRDLWKKDQLNAFNAVLLKCFERHLPVPRSRRIRSEQQFSPASKASYRIVQEDEVVQIETLTEKAHQYDGHNNNNNKEVPFIPRQGHISEDDDSDDESDERWHVHSDLMLDWELMSD